MTATDLRPPEEVTEELTVLGEPPRPARRRPHLGAVWPVVTSGVLAYLGSRFVFPLLSVNHDEATYLLQAEALRHGALTIPAPAHAAAFVPWLAGLRHGRFVFKYTPFHAAFLAFGRTIF